MNTVWQEREALSMDAEKIYFQTALESIWLSSTALEAIQPLLPYSVGQSELAALPCTHLHSAVI